MRNVLTRYYFALVEFLCCQKIKLLSARLGYGNAATKDSEDPSGLKSTDSQVKIQDVYDKDYAEKTITNSQPPTTIIYHSVVPCGSVPFLIYQKKIIITHSQQRCHIFSSNFFGHISHWNF